MAVLSKADLLNTIKELVGDDTSDSAIHAIENINDTIADYESRSSEDWKKKFEENDAEWRSKYKERFFSGGSVQVVKSDIEDDNHKKLTYESLFKYE